MFPSELVKADIPVEIIFDKYWEEVCKAVSYGGFDSTAHIDFKWVIMSKKTKPYKDTFYASGAFIGL